MQAWEVSSNMVEEPNEVSVSSISIEYDLEPSVTQEKEVVWILGKLEAPTSSELSRKRKLASNTVGGNR